MTLVGESIAFVVALICGVTWLLLGLVAWQVYLLAERSREQIEVSRQTRNKVRRVWKATTEPDGPGL